MLLLLKYFQTRSCHLRFSQYRLLGRLFGSTESCSTTPRFHSLQSDGIEVEVLRFFTRCQALRRRVREKNYIEPALPIRNVFHPCLYGCDCSVKALAKDLLTEARLISVNVPDDGPATSPRKLSTLSLHFWDEPLPLLFFSW